LGGDGGSHNAHASYVRKEKDDKGRSYRFDGEAGPSWAGGGGLKRGGFGCLGGKEEKTRERKDWAGEREQPR
jgi:hypothetical protein